MNMEKRLRKGKDGTISGVCAGLAEYFGWDVTIVRMAWAISILLAGTGIGVYFLAAIIMPEAYY